ncbi:juvenile hormone esterase-like [Periplaneta americana]|uniref:juvenile hormone esterase-like n=1 Tax=Periplaneta americana TaxID=6978 RepID=UPI0037E869FD
MKIYKITSAVLLLIAGMFFTVDASFFTNLLNADGCAWWQSKQVTVKQGTMKGSTMFSQSGRPFCAFRGIPFSQPPVGEYRFKPPQPPVSWTGVLDASKETPQCIRLVFLLGIPAGTEDCLYLGIFTPRLNNAGKELMDVMVWFYPGEFYFGQSAISWEGPQFLMDKDVVLVYINYRLGAFGFLSTGDDEAPGNYGLKDQVAGLRWVQDNIEAFGGDPGKITLFGQSAGAASAHLHMMSSSSRGLFHRVISFEGTAVNPWARSFDPLRLAQKQAKVMECPTEPTSSLVQCLRTIDAKKLMGSLTKLFIWWLLPGPGFAPVVEKTTARNPEPFLTEDPLVLMREGRFQRVPWLMGATNQGAGTFVAPVFNLLLLKMQGVLNYKTLLPKLLLLNVSGLTNADQISNVTDEMLEFYVGESSPLKNYDNFTTNILNMMTDRFMVHGVHKAAQLHAHAGHTDVYKYNFAYRGTKSFSEITSLKNYGAAHTDELWYIFKVLYQKNWGYDFEVQELMTSLVINFAKYGNPTPGNNTGNYLVDQLKWLPIVESGSNISNILYLDIDRVVTSPGNTKYLGQGLGPVRLQMKTNLFKERMNFMDSLPLNENCVENCV